MSFQYASVDAEENASNTSFEKDSFLTDEDLAPLRKSTLRRICTLRNLFILFPWLLVIGLSVMLAHTARVSLGRRDELGEEHYSPAYDQIQYEEVLFYRGFGDGTQGQSVYQGWPNDERDRLWDELYDNGFSTRIDAARNAPLRNQTMHFPVEGYEKDYVVNIDVFHQLHCLNQLRKQIYPKRYKSSVVDPDGTVSWSRWMHIDHCVESLRQSLTCSADITANGFDWRDDVKFVMPRVNSVHKCRNFEKIREWAFERFVPLNNLQSHVENGRIVDWTGKVPNPLGADQVQTHPEFKYTVDDM